MLVLMRFPGRDCDRYSSLGQCKIVRILSGPSAAGGKMQTGQPNALVEKVYLLTAEGNMEGMIKGLEQLKAKGHDIGTQVRRNGGHVRTLLLQAAAHSRWEIVLYILTLPAACSSVHLNARDKNSMSAFMYAAQHGPRKVIRKFLAKKYFKNLDLTAGDLYGRSALFLAATCGQPNVVLELLNRGAYLDVDEMTVWGSTPLTAVSAGSQREEVLRYLLRAGADFEAKELDTHKTALDLATEKGWVDKVQILEDAERAYLLHKLHRLSHPPPPPAAASPPCPSLFPPSDAGSTTGSDSSDASVAADLKPRLSDKNRPRVQLRMPRKRGGGSERVASVLAHVVDRMDTRDFDSLLALLRP